MNQIQITQISNAWLVAFPTIEQGKPGKVVSCASYEEVCEAIKPLFQPK